MKSRHITASLLILIMVSSSLYTQKPNQIEQFDVFELNFNGPEYSEKDNPTVEAEFTTFWQYENNENFVKIAGFWDRDGQGGAKGHIFKVRFCPTRPGKWTLAKVVSNIPELNGQQAGFSLVCVKSDRKGFWVVDDQNSGGRWYRRSDGSHQYILGNTMYSFLSECNWEGSNTGSIQKDVSENAKYFKKIRFSITGCRYPHPDDKPFLNNEGNPTDDGNFSHRPNPTWFTKRVDLAVQEAFKHDLIADIIINGPDTEDARSILKARENNGNYTPILNYIVARYGSYPNVWLCISNEWDIKKPRYAAAEINQIGHRLVSLLPYPTPVSVHGNQHDWDTELNTLVPWHDHIILQNKIKKLPAAADFIFRNYWIGLQKPVIDDELAYEGAGDGWSEADVIEAHLGAFLGGGYASTGHKFANKKGHYFAGNFSANEHLSADNLKWMREKIDSDITFWKLVPCFYAYSNHIQTSIFSNIHDTFRALEWPGQEYVLGTNQAQNGIIARLPAGSWQIKQFDLMKMEEKFLSGQWTDHFKFNSPDSRAVLFHFKRID
ncbi:DUF5060 domain-containing protein [candidate division KSB1 bacterium]|nr:DUF5060 domain-containing protein [candidate division KSB1 bacterium]